MFFDHRDISEKIQTGRGENIESPEVFEEEACGKSRGQLKEVDFPGMMEKTLCGISISFAFRPWNFQGCHRILQKFQW